MEINNEDTWSVIESYFKNKHLHQLVKHQIESYNDFIQNKGWLNSKTNGKMRLEGKDYIVRDGDVLNFRFNT